KFVFSSRRRHTRSKRDWSSDVCSSDLIGIRGGAEIDRCPVEQGAQRAGTGACSEPGTDEATAIKLPAANEDQGAALARGPWISRSEERRVGKEGRVRLGEDHRRIRGVI